MNGMSVRCNKATLKCNNDIPIKKELRISFIINIIKEAWKLILLSSTTLCRGATELRKMSLTLRPVACELFSSSLMKSIARLRTTISQRILRFIFTLENNLAVFHEAEAIHHNRFLG